MLLQKAGEYGSAGLHSYELMYKSSWIYVGCLFICSPAMIQEMIGLVLRNDTASRISVLHYSA